MCCHVDSVSMTCMSHICVGICMHVAGSKRICESCRSMTRAIKRFEISFYYTSQHVKEPSYNGN